MNRISKLRKIVWFIDDSINFLLLVILLILLTFGCYSLWDSNQIYSAASSVQYEIYKPSEEDSLSFQELEKINPDVLGWITVYGTGIDYPLVQGEDNWEYLNKDADGSYSLAGSIFLDSANAKDFSDYNTLIHGHHMEASAMFGDITNFDDKDFFEKHQYGNLFVNGRNYGIVFFAYMLVDAYDGNIYRSPIVNEDKQMEYLQHLQSEAMHLRTASQAEAEKIILLSTCSNGMTNGRNILVGYLTEQVYENEFVVEEAEKEIKTLDQTNGWKEFEKIPLWIWMLLLLIFLILVRIVFDRISKKKRLERAIRMQSDNVKGNEDEQSQS